MKCHVFRFAGVVYRGIIHNRTGNFFFPFGVDRELMVLLPDWVRINEQCQRGP